MFPTRKFPRMPKSLLKKPKGFRTPRVEDFKADMQRLGQDIAEEFKQRVIDNIENNEYGFILSESTMRHKHSMTPLIETHEMVDAIFRDGTTVSVEDTPREDSRLTNLELAMVHEYGTKDKHIPARPVWRNTFRDFKEDAKDMIDDFLETKKFKGDGRDNRS